MGKHKAITQAVIGISLQGCIYEIDWNLLKAWLTHVADKSPVPMKAPVFAINQSAFDNMYKKSPPVEVAPRERIVDARILLQELLALYESSSLSEHSLINDNMNLRVQVDELKTDMMKLEVELRRLKARVGM